MAVSITRREALASGVAAMALAAVPTPSFGDVAQAGAPSPWAWWAGTDEERFCFGPCATRERLLATVDMDLVEEGFHVVEARMTQPTFRLGREDVEWLRGRTSGSGDVPVAGLDGRTVLDMLDDANDEALDPDDHEASLFARRPTDAQAADLASRVERALREGSDGVDEVERAVASWVRAHGLKARTFRFAAQRNDEYVAPRPCDGGEHGADGDA